ncbi:MAG TPA: hypothetical protein VKW06_01825 [Candidatus Angelobacter sp.]|nr:hypothetical protein [Candidatus Angelobacter sp.]
MSDNKRVFVLRFGFRPGLLLLGMGLLAVQLLAQNSGAGDKKDSKDSKSSESQPASAGVMVDSARKSSDLMVTWDQTQTNRGETTGVYDIKQSVEFGGRISDFSGSTGMWDTLVNMGTGPRLLEYTLEIHSPKHDGLLFDDLALSNFGYGGDPNDMSRLNVQKGKLYNLNASFRRDQNIFDNDLLANPLNPATSNPAVQINDSPHLTLLTRRMSDVNLSLFPVSPIRIRMGWSRVVNEGSQFSSFHQGTEALLDQPTLNTTDNYNIGVSLRFIPRTSINYDQFYTYFKGDTTAQLSGFGLPSFALAGGIPVNLGVSFNTPAGQPCATPVLGTGFVNPACNGFFGLSRPNDRVRTDFPTEQFSFQSNYFRRADMSGRLSYAGGESDLPGFAQVFTGLETRTRARAQAEAGVSDTRRLSLNADFGITFRITDRLRFVDAFRYDNFRLPGTFSLLTGTLFGATLLSNPNVFSPATCPPPFTAATCPQHLASSGPDLIQENFFDFLRQDQKINTSELEYDFTKRFSAHLGFRYENREITHNTTDIQVQAILPTQAVARGCATAAGCTLTVTTPDAVFVPINAFSAIFGFAARPTDRLRVSFDVEDYYADNTYTRISPRHEQWYKARGSYRANDWVNLGAALNIREGRNDTADVGNLQHNRSFAFNTAIAPPEGKWGLDLGYDYNDIFSQTNICFVATPATPGALSCGTPFLTGLSVYTETSHNVNSSVFLRPVRRLTAAVGYTVTSSNGSTLILNPNAPTGPLAFNYHLPTGSLAYEFSKQLTFKGGWNYYDYNEKSVAGPTLPRDFRGNTFTLSLRYSM